MSNNLPSRFQAPGLFSFLAYLAIVTLIVISLQGAGFDSELELKDVIPSMWDFIKQLFPPSLDRIDSVASALWITIQMAVSGTLLGLLISLPLCIFASSNYTPHKIFFIISRGLISLFRTIPDLIWALFFVITVGLGPLAGTLALMIDTIGFCGRFFAEAIEESDPQPAQGLQALGANRTATIFCAVLPDVLPSFTNTALFSLEKAVRSSVVLGLVGAGGIGIELKVSMETLRFAEASTIIIAILILVIIVERLSTWIRSKLI